MASMLVKEEIRNHAFGGCRDIGCKNFVQPNQSHSFIGPCILLNTIYSSIRILCDLSLDCPPWFSFVHNQGGSFVPSAHTVKKTVARPTEVFISFAFTVFEPTLAGIFLFESCRLRGVWSMFIINLLSLFPCAKSCCVVRSFLWIIL